MNICKTCRWCCEEVCCNGDSRHRADFRLEDETCEKWEETMDKYIEKNKVVNLLAAVADEFQRFEPFEGFEHAMYRKLCEAEIAIGKLPAADVVPVVHGTWDDDGHGIIICSECGSGYNLISRYAHYCPHCGARMDGGADDD